jgi:predicted acetyltransferase
MARRLTGRRLHQDATISPSVVRASAADHAVLVRMLADYLRELVAFEDPQSPSSGEPGEDNYDYSFLESYWHDKRRLAFLIHPETSGPLGFTLVNDWSASGLAVDWSIAEFFIERRHRRRGIGRRVAVRIFEDLPGSWEVPVLKRNVSAQAFWRSTIAAFLGTAPIELQGDGERWDGPILRFASPPFSGR